MDSLLSFAVTLRLETGITPTTEKRAPLGFQHLEHPHAWLWATLLVSVTSTGLLWQRQCSFPPEKSEDPFVRPLSISGWREGAMSTLLGIFLYCWIDSWYDCEQQISELLEIEIFLEVCSKGSPLPRSFMSELVPLPHPSVHPSRHQISTSRLHNRTNCPTMAALTTSRTPGKSVCVGNCKSFPSTWPSMIFQEILQTPRKRRGCRRRKKRGYCLLLSSETLEPKRKKMKCRRCITRVNTAHLSLIIIFAFLFLISLKE